MSVDKSWLIHPNRKSDEYQQGLNSFIERCKEHIDTRGFVRCACAKCDNTDLIPFELMKKHMMAYGICRNYTEWIYHGESLVPPVVVVDDVGPTNDMVDVIEDVMNEYMEEDTEDLDEGSNGVRDDFEELLKEAEKELYPGCTKFSSLDFLAKLMHIKVKNKWTNSSFDELLELLQSSHPEGNKVPPSHYVAKKTLKKLGLGYESIHVCKNDCALFWAEHRSLHNCPICNESRWVDPDTEGKKVPHKILRYFPLTPRLRRLYCSRHKAKDMIWHSTGRSQDGTMRHPVDGSSWKEFDIKHPDFSTEPRNVRLGLAADGFNPFGNVSTASHSSWTYKKNQSPLDTYRDAHTLRNGTFASELEENNYNKLKEEYEFQSAQLNQEHPFFEGEDELIGSTPKPNVVGVFEKVLGARSGYYRGLGRKPSISSAASAAGPHHEEIRCSRFTEEDYDEIVGDPRFMARIFKALKNNKGSTSGTSGNADDADEGEE